MSDSEDDQPDHNFGPLPEVYPICPDGKGGCESYICRPDKDGVWRHRAGPRESDRDIIMRLTLELQHANQEITAGLCQALENPDCICNGCLKDEAIKQLNIAENKIAAISDVWRRRPKLILYDWFEEEMNKALAEPAKSRPVMLDGIVPFGG